MSIRTICAGFGALALIGGLAACGTTAATQPAPAPTVTDRHGQVRYPGPPSP